LKGDVVGAKHPLWSQDGRVTIEAVEAALKRLLTEDRVRLSERNRRFLTFVVSEALAGRGSRIKAYTIGVDVFGRGDDFDPSIDPIVRIEATRIRSALSAYYENSGSSDPIKIQIPPGSYAPVFTSCDSKPTKLADEDDNFPKNEHPSIAGAIDHRPAIVVTTLPAVSHDRSSVMLLELLKQSIGIRLRTLKLRVFFSPPPERKAATQAVEKLLLQPDSAYALDVVLYLAPEGCRQSWALTDLSTGELMDSMFVDRKDIPGPTAIEEIVEKVAEMIESALALN
jgi:hypothetical protein